MWCRSLVIFIRRRNWGGGGDAAPPRMTQPQDMPKQKYAELPDRLITRRYQTARPDLRHVKIGRPFTASDSAQSGDSGSRSFELKLKLRSLHDRGAFSRTLWKLWYRLTHPFLPRRAELIKKILSFIGSLIHPTASLATCVIFKPRIKI